MVICQKNKKIKEYLPIWAELPSLQVSVTAGVSETELQAASGHRVTVAEIVLQKIS